MLYSLYFHRMCEKKCVFVSYCRITIYYTFSILNINSLSHRVLRSSLGACYMGSQGVRLQSIPPRAAVSSKAQSPVSSLLGRFQFLVVGLRSLLSCWVSARGSSQLVETTSPSLSLVWPFPQHSSWLLQDQP